MRGGWGTDGSPHHAPHVSAMEETKTLGERFAISREETAGRVTYSLGVSSEDVPELVGALKRAGRDASGYTIEAFVISLSEIGDPTWAGELAFDSEASRCVVRCARHGPLRRLAERLERRLAKKTALRRLVEGLPRE